MLRSIEKSITSPCCRRSSGTRPIPAAIAAVGEPGGSFFPSIRTAPASQRSMPKIARATSVRPAPTSPASATISPLQTWNETSVKTPSRVSRSTSRTTRPRSLATFGKSASMSRPTIARITDCVVSSPVGCVSTWCPSRITVTRWQSANTSSSRCEMKSTAAPRARSVSTIRNSRCTSDVASAAVGSSITITRACAVSAFAISTSCWSAIESPRAGRSGSSRTPSWSKSCIVSRRIRRASIRRPRFSGCDADEDVLGHAQVGEERRLLEDDRDPGLLRLLRGVEDRLLAVEHEPAARRAGGRPRGSSRAWTCRRRSRRRGRAPRRA